MKDTRFSTAFDSTADLLSGVDIDDVGLRRPTLDEVFLAITQRSPATRAA